MGCGTGADRRLHPCSLSLFSAISAPIMRTTNTAIPPTIHENGMISVQSGISVVAGASVGGCSVTRVVNGTEVPSSTGGVCTGVDSGGVVAVGDGEGVAGVRDWEM